MGCWSKAAWNLKCSLYLFYSQDIPPPRDIPERLTLLETTTVMCELKRRVSHSMNSTCENRPEVLQGEELSYRRRAATEFSICLWSETELLLLVTAVAQMRERCTTQMSERELYFYVVMKCGESSDAESGILQRARRAACLSSKPASVGLKVPSPRRLSTSNSWRSLSTAKVGRNARTSGAGPIFKHISQLNNLCGWQDEDIQIHDWPGSPHPIPYRLVKSNVKERQLKLLKYCSSVHKIKTYFIPYYLVSQMLENDLLSLWNNSTFVPMKSSDPLLVLKWCDVSLCQTGTPGNVQEVNTEFPPSGCTE